MFSVAAADESPVAAKLKKLWLKAPTTEEAEAAASIGKCTVSQPIRLCREISLANQRSVCGHIDDTNTFSHWL